MSSDYAPPEFSLDALRKILSREYTKVLADPSGRPKAAIHIYEELVASRQDELADLLMYYHSVTGAIPPPMSDRPNITYNISGSTIGSATFSSQVGSINSSVNAVSQQPGGIDFAAALKSLTDVVLKSNELAETEKREALDALELVGKQAEEPPEKRKSGVLKPVLDSIPKLLSTASTAINVWHSVGPHILEFFGYV